MWFDKNIAEIILKIDWRLLEYRLKMFQTFAFICVSFGCRLSLFLSSPYLYSLSLGM